MKWQGREGLYLRTLKEIWNLSKWGLGYSHKNDVLDLCFLGSNVVAKLWSSSENLSIIYLCACTQRNLSQKHRHGALNWISYNRITVWMCYG